jgi:hypothetical protein
MKFIGLDREPQRFILTEQMRLSKNLIERSRPHTVSQRMKTLLSFK